MKITNEQRDFIDNQIRVASLAQLPERNALDVPVALILDARRSAGLGIYLENACPYIRNCSHKGTELCIRPAYRECPFYKTSLALDVISGNINLNSS